MTTTTTFFDATLTLQQLTGSNAANRMLALLIGARDFVKSDEDAYVQFGFKGCRKANKCRITLAADDTYTLTFYKYNRKTFECPVVEETEGVYNDMLKAIFESFTGLYLSLR